MKEHAITYVGAAIISLLLFTTIFAFVSNSKNKRNLNEEKLQTESLLSEKLLIQKELDNLKSDQAALSSKNEATEKLLASTELKLAEREKRISSLTKNNNSLNKTVQELADLQNEKADLDKIYADLKLEHEKGLAQARELQSSVSALEAQKSEITGKFRDAELYNSDNFVVYGTRGKTKEKLTLRACRTKQLNMNFEVPQSLTEAISFTILTPSGTLITPENQALSWDFIQDPGNFTASLSSVTGEFEQSREVVLKYAPKEKLTSGEYKIQILCGIVNIGNCRIKLK